MMKENKIFLGQSFNLRNDNLNYKKALRKNTNEELVSSLKDIFTTPDKIEVQEKQEFLSRKKAKKNIDKSDLPYLESVDIKEDWEKTPFEKKAKQDQEYNKKGRIMPSRSEKENNYGGTGDLKAKAGSANNIFDFNAVSAKKKTTGDIIVEEARMARQQRQERRERSRDWEVVSKAKTTEDVPASQMGFTPNRSSFKPAPLPKVKISGLGNEELKMKKVANKKKADFAFKIRKAMSDSHLAKLNKDSEEDKSWEDEALDEINQRKNASSNSKIEFSGMDSHYIGNTMKKPEADLSGIFTEKVIPKEEKKLKRNANFKKPRRSREDARKDWENMNNVRSKKY